MADRFEDSLSNSGGSSTTQRAMRRFSVKQRLFACGAVGAGVVGAVLIASGGDSSLSDSSDCVAWFGATTGAQVAYANQRGDIGELHEAWGSIENACEATAPVGPGVTGIATLGDVSNDFAPGVYATPDYPPDFPGGEG